MNKKELFFILSLNYMESDQPLLEHSFSEGSCPYCDVPLNQIELQHHLDWCEVYETLIRTFSRNSVRSRIRSALRHSRVNQLSDPVTSEDELPSTIRYLERLSDSSSSSSPEPLSENLPVHKRQSLLTNKKQGALGCPVCAHEYLESSKPPLVLPSCGHTVCEQCLQQIVEHFTVIKCPVCRTLNFKEVENLPINYALLELAGLREVREQCAKHSLELVGYCKDEEVLLCGACVFEHKDHNSFLLSDPRTIEIAERKKELLVSQEKALQGLKNNWEQVISGLNEQFKEIHEIAELHVKGLKNSEKSMISEIRAGTHTCVQQIKQIVNNKHVTELQQQLSSKVRLINNELEQLKDRQSKFNTLSMVQRLKHVEVGDHRPGTPPSLSPVAELTKKLQVIVDYKEAIKTQKFHIQNDKMD